MRPSGRIFFLQAGVRPADKDFSGRRNDLTEYLKDRREAESEG